MAEKRERSFPMNANNIKRFRAEKKMTQEELASRAGLSSVKMIESGRNIVSIKSLHSIAKALDVSVYDLLEDPNDAMPEALYAFLQTPAAADITPDEIEQLKRLRARGKRPTEATYYIALQAIRTMVSDNEA